MISPVCLSRTYSLHHVSAYKHFRPLDKYKTCEKGVRLAENKQYEQTHAMPATSRIMRSLGAFWKLKTLFDIFPFCLNPPNAWMTFSARQVAIMSMDSLGDLYLYKNVTPF